MMVSVIEDARVGDVLRMKVLRDKKYIGLSLKLEKRST